MSERCNLALHGKCSGQDGGVVCIPRGVCIKMCGPEKPGCVYSGSCASQTCFTGKKSGRPAELTRVTHVGPGSIITVDDIADGEPVQPPVSTSAARSGVVSRIIVRGLDSCSRAGGLKFHLETDECDREGTQALVDGKPGPATVGDTDGTQCRAACSFFSNENFEIVRFKTECEVCGRSDADAFFGEESKYICISAATCRERCGIEQPFGSIKRDSTNGHELL